MGKENIYSRLRVTPDGTKIIIDMQETPIEIRVIDQGINIKDQDSDSWLQINLTKAQMATISLALITRIDVASL